MQFKTSILFVSIGFMGKPILADGEELSSSTGDGVETGSCNKLVTEIRQSFVLDLVLPDGTTRNATDLGPDIYTTGLLQYFSGDVQDEKGETVGKSHEKFTMIDEDGNSIGDGYYYDIAGCKGTLSFSGPYFSSTETGYYTVLGGTGDFLGAKGLVLENYDEASGQAIRKITLREDDHGDGPSLAADDEKGGCTELVTEIQQSFVMDLVLPDGTTRNATDLGPDIYTTGLLQYFSGDVQDEKGETVGKSHELFTMIDEDGNSIGDGNYIDIAGCKGTLSFSGPYFSSTETGYYTVLGGTGDFLGAKGLVLENYDEASGQAIRKITLHEDDYDDSPSLAVDDEQGGCTELVTEIRQSFVMDLVLPDGTTRNVTDLGPDIYTTGLLQYFSGDVQDEKGETVGKSHELFTMIDEDGNSIGEGNYVDIAGCKGTLSFSGPYFSSTETGYYSVLGGTGDFLGAKGLVLENYDEDSGQAIRKITLHEDDHVNELSVGAENRSTEEKSSAALFKADYLILSAIVYFYLEFI